MLKQEKPSRMRLLVGSALLAALTSSAGFTAWAAMPVERRLVEAPARQPTASNREEPDPRIGPLLDPNTSYSNEPGSIPQPTHYEPDQLPPLPLQKADDDAFDSTDPVHLLGMVEKIDFSDKTYVAFVRAHSIAPCPTGPAQPNTHLWELSPTPYWGDRNAVIRDLMNQSVYVRGFNAKDKSCTSNCRMLARGVFKATQGAGFTDPALTCRQSAPRPIHYEPQQTPSIQQEPTPQAGPQPIQYQQQPPSMPSTPLPIAGFFVSNSPVNLETDTPIRLRGKVERIDFRDTSYVIFLRATGISRDFGDPSPGRPAFPRAYQPNTDLWELSPTNYFGDRDAIRADLMGKNVEVRGRNINKSCSPSCKVKLAELIMPHSTAVPPPAANASLITQFGQWYDTTALSYVRGKVERIDFHERTFDAYIRTDARGATPSQLIQARSEYSFPRADIERELLNKTVTATGWRAREGISTFCDPVCGLYATDLEFPNMAKLSPAGQTLLSEPMPDAPAEFREVFDWNAPMTIEGKILRVESSGAISGPNDRNLANAVWVEATSVEPDSTPGAKPGTTWRVIGGGLPLPVDQWIGHPVTASGYNAKDKTCTPTCSMSHGSMSVR